MMKLISSLSLFFVITQFSNVHLCDAAITITPEAPLTFVNKNGINTVFILNQATYAGSVAPATGSTAAFPNRNLNDTASGSDITLAFTAASTDKPFLYLMAKNTADNYQIIPLTSCGATASCGINASLGVPASGRGVINEIHLNTSETGVAITLNLATICAAYPLVNGCDSLSTATAENFFDFYIYESGSSLTSAPSDPESEAIEFMIAPQSSAPSISEAICPDPSEITSVYTPGDGAIYLNTNIISATATTNTSSVSSPTMTSAYVAISNTLTLNSSNFTSAEILKDASLNSSNYEVTGLTNSTNGSDNQYNMLVGVKDSAGAISFCNAGVPYSPVVSANIQTFLKDSNCFIATASFRSGRAEPVMMLRHFRDQILLKSRIGQHFVKAYYQYAPHYADLLIEHSEFRPVVLHLLIPIQMIAWSFLNLKWLLLFGLFSWGFTFIFSRRSIVYKSKMTRILTIFILTGFIYSSNSSAQEQTQSVQPYIDHLMSKPDFKNHKEDTEIKNVDDGTEEPYIHSIQKKLKPQTERSLIDQIQKQKSGESEEYNPDTSYTEQLKKKLDSKGESKDESAFEDLKNGKKLKADKGDLWNTKSMFGFTLGLGITRELESSSGQEIAFESVYGSGWIPDFRVIYEYRPFHLSRVIDLGITSVVGVSWVKNFGKLPDWATGLGYSTQSQTAVTMIILPINLGGTLRFNLASFIYPYFGAGPNITGFIEKRYDNQASQRGYSLGYWITAGVNLGMDWLSSSSSWDRYESTGTKHSYISLEYTRIETSKGLVQALIQGINLGFAFEF